MSSLPAPCVLAEELPAPLRDHPSKLFVETTTFCNLRCPMCVKQATDSKIIDGDMSVETFSALEPVFPRLEALLLNGIGEALMHPHLLDFIHRARRLMPEQAWIGFQSNGLLLDERWARDLVASGLDRICLSVDGVSPDTFSKVREGEDLSDMERAFGYLAAARKREPSSRLKVGAEFVLMRENMEQLPDTVRWVAERGGDFVIVSQALPYDEAHLDQPAFDNATDAAVEIFERWKGKMADEGIDINSYSARWEMARFLPRLDPKLKRLMILVDQMRAEAREADIFIDIPRLLQRNTEKAKRMEELFAEAERVAEERGLELKLPAAVPRHERKCDFVGDGGAFISWDGAVHPCYFLWHHFRCWTDDWDRLIKPKVFGRVDQRPLLEIWNDSGFRDFRENVHKFDYPNCYNCTVVPCDLLQDEDFDVDCYARPEPCGACQWAMGLFQCLS